MMIATIFEFCLSCMIFTYLLYFYLILVEEEWDWKKAIISIVMIAVLQSWIEQFEFHQENMMLMDSIIIILYLLIYHRKWNMISILSAVLIDLIYGVLVPVIAFGLSFVINIETTYEFGIERVLFCMVLHSLIIGILYMITKPLVNIKKYVNQRTFSVICISMIVVNEGFDFIYQALRKNENVAFYLLVMLAVILILYYVILHYCIVIKENYDAQVINRTTSLTAEYVQLLEKEHEQVKKIRHDMKNKLQILYHLQKEKNYDRVEEILKESMQGIKNNTVSISGNIFIDAILKQKMSQFPQIVFHTEIILTDDFEMDANDLISLLCNLIDNGCEELLRIEQHDFYLKLKGDSSQLMIKQQNACKKGKKLKTDKNSEYHGYGMRIIDDIIEKYDGIKETKVEEIFLCKITLFL